MAINFPTSLDNFTNPSSGNTLDSPSHSLQHSDINDAVEALEAKLGIGASPAGSATSGYVLTANTGGTTTWSALPASGGLIQIAPASVTVTGAGSSATVGTSGAVTFSSSTTVSMNTLFTSTYDSYLMDITLTSITSQDMALKLRSGTTDTSTNYDYGLYGFGASATTRSASGSNTTKVLCNRGNTATATNRIGWQTVIQAPLLAQPTTFLTVASGTDGTGWFGWSGAGCYFQNTTFDGLTIVFDGNCTGVVRFYGYKK